MPEEELQAKIYLCHAIAIEKFKLIGYLADLILSIISSAHASYPTTFPTNIKCLLYDNNDIKIIRYLSCGRA